ncbi:MAG: cytidylate kinase-like family protein [Ruminococcaceae bacterium]|nr:cytidylate kinase-like family protein [Oscillospiraceae bacterium]
MQMKNTVITIGRQYGSGGKEFGKKLAEAMGYSFYDEELLSITSEKSNIDEDVLKMADERATNSLLYSLVVNGGLRGVLTQGVYELPINDKVFLAQADSIKHLAQQESCVIVGRCADYVLQDTEDINKIDLFIYADMESRIERIAKIYNLTPAEAKDKIVKTEKKRKTYYNYYSNQEWGRMTNYDLCINVSGLGSDGAVAVAKAYIEKRIAE